MFTVVMEMYTVVYFFSGHSVYNEDMYHVCLRFSVIGDICAIILIIM